MQVRHYMTETVSALAPETSIQDAILFMTEHRFRHIPILQDGLLVGMVTDGDLKRATPSLLEEDMSREKYLAVLQETTLLECMIREPITISPDSYLIEAVKIMHSEKISGLPVVKSGRLIGMITEIDIFRAFEEMLSRATHDEQPEYQAGSD